MEEKNLFSFFGNSFLEIQFTYHAVHLFISYSSILGWKLSWSVSKILLMKNHSTGQNKVVSGVEESGGWCQASGYPERALEG